MAASSWMAEPSVYKVAATVDSTELPTTPAAAQALARRKRAVMSGCGEAG